MRSSGGHHQPSGCTPAALRLIILIRYEHNLVRVAAPPVRTVEDPHPHTSVEEGAGLQHFRKGRIQMLWVEMDVGPFHHP